MNPSARFRLDHRRPSRFRAVAGGGGWASVGANPGGTGSVAILMGSLIKKRRKRMRKKKHKKMLKRTRFKRRAAGK